MACRLFGAKPLPEPTQTYWQLDPWEQNSVKFEQSTKVMVHKNAFENSSAKWRSFCPGVGWGGWCGVGCGVGWVGGWVVGWVDGDELILSIVLPAVAPCPQWDAGGTSRIKCTQGCILE